MKRLAIAAALLASLALPSLALADNDNLWTPDCQYLSQYGLGDAVRVRCDQVVFDFQKDAHGQPYVEVVDGDADYTVPPALFIRPTTTTTTEFDYLWVDSTAGSVCGVSFGSHVPFVQCSQAS